jgi:hypothetical protein
MLPAATQLPEAYRKRQLAAAPAGSPAMTSDEFTQALSRLVGEAEDAGLEEQAAAMRVSEAE